MILRNAFLSFVLVFLPVTYLVVKQYQSIPVTKTPNLDSQDLISKAKKIGSLINQGENIGELTVE